MIVIHWTFLILLLQIKKAQAIDFFKNSVATTDGWDKAYYAVKAEFNKTASAFSSTQISTGAAVITTGSALSNIASNVVNTVSWTSNNITEVTASAIATQPKIEGKVKNESVKYSVVSISTADFNKIKANRNVEAGDFDYVGKALTESYSVVPMKDVSNISINKLNKQYIDLGLGGYASGAEAGFKADHLNATLSAIKSAAPAGVKYSRNGTDGVIPTSHEQDVKLSGSYNGVSLVIPSNYASFSSDKVVITSAKIANVTTAALKAGDFFDASKANFVRKDGSDTITATVSKVTSGALSQYISDVSATGATASAITQNLQQAEPKTTLAFSDATPVPAKVQVAGEAVTINPADTKITAAKLMWFGLNADSSGKQKLDSKGDYIIKGNVWAEDQYGKSITPDLWAMNVSDVKENAGDFAHLDKSFAINANDTDQVTIDKAELGDTFTLKYTATKNGVSASATVKVTVGSDDSAYIANGYDSDKDFRQDYLFYEY